MATSVPQNPSPFGLLRSASYAGERAAPSKPKGQDSWSFRLYRLFKQYTLPFARTATSRVSRGRLKTMYRRLDEKERALTERLAGNFNAVSRRRLVRELRVTVLQKKKALRLIEGPRRG